MFTVTLTLLAAGTDTGPFNLYSNVDGYVSAFETGVSKASLLGGYTTYSVPDGTSIIRVCSTGVCTNCVDFVIGSSTTTTSTSTSSPNTEINIINNTDGVTIDNILMGINPLPPGSGLYPGPGDSYLTTYPSGTYNVTVTLLNVPNNNTTVRIDDGDLIHCYTYPAGISVSYTFVGVFLSGIPSTITVNTNPC